MSSSTVVPNQAFNEANKNNPYLDTLMRPWVSSKFRLPDMNMTTARHKSASQTGTLVAVKDECLFMYTPYNPLFPLRLYSRTTAVAPAAIVDPTANEGFLYVRTIPLDEDLAASFSHARLISSGVAIDSATRSGGTIDLSGTMNAIQFQDRLNLKTLTFNTLPSFKRNENDVAVQQSVLDGIVALAAPYGAQDYKLVETRNAFNVESKLALTRTLTVPAGAVAGGASVFMNALSVTNGTMPEGIFGRYKIRVTLEPTNAPWMNPQVWFMTLTPFAPKLSETDWNTVTNQINPIDFQQDSSGRAIEIEGFTDAELRSVGITFTNAGIPPVDPSATFLTPNFKITLEAYEYYNRGFNDQGAAIALTGLSPPTAGTAGQVIAINGKYNYEVVPTTELARQLSTDYGIIPENPLMMKATEYFIAMGNLRFIYNKREYELAVTMNSFDKLISNKNVAQASGLADGLLGLLRSFQPILSNIPVVGTVVDTVLGPTAHSAGTWRQANSSGTWAQSSGSIPTRGPRIGYMAPLNSDAEQAALIDGATFSFKKFDARDYQYDDINSLIGRGFMQDGSTAGILTYAGSRGIIDGVPYTLVANRFPIVSAGKAYVGQAIASSMPLIPEYLRVQFNLSNGVSGEFNVAANSTLNSSAMYAIASAVAVSGFTTEEYLHVVLDEADIDFTDLAGPSLGMAVLNSMLRRNTRGLLTGYVNEEGKLCAVGEYGLKTQLAKELSTVLIAPYNPIYLDGGVDPLLIMAKNSGSFYGPYQAQIGDWSANGKNPQIILPNDLGSYNLNIIISMNALSADYKPGAFVKEVSYKLVNNTVVPQVKETGIVIDGKEYDRKEATKILTSFLKGQDMKYYLKLPPLSVLEKPETSADALIKAQIVAGNLNKAFNVKDGVHDYVDSVRRKREEGLYGPGGQRLKYGGKAISMDEADKILAANPGTHAGSLGKIARNGTALKILIARESQQKTKKSDKPKMLPQVAGRRGIPRQPAEPSTTLAPRTAAKVVTPELEEAVFEEPVGIEDEGEEEVEETQYEEEAEEPPAVVTAPQRAAETKPRKGLPITFS